MAKPTRFADIHFEMDLDPSHMERLMAAMKSGLITRPDYTGWKMNAGPYCNDHRSMYCEHALYYIEQRSDVPNISAAITGEQSEFPNASKDDGKSRQLADLHIIVPVYPQYCIWEQLYYEVNDLGEFGYVGELTPEYLRTKKGLHGVRRILPGESAHDLAVTLRQQFEDDLEFYRDDLVNRQPGGVAPTWMRCRSATHSFRYNNMATKLASPHVIEGAIDGRNQDRVLVYSNLYCYMRHQRCMFCYVNENFRDAVRVNPELSGYMPELLGGDADGDNTNDFEDLVPF